jgi:hypothetical protein
MVEWDGRVYSDCTEFEFRTRALRPVADTGRFPGPGIPETDARNTNDATVSCFSVVHSAVVLSWVDVFTSQLYGNRIRGELQP